MIFPYYSYSHDDNYQIKSERRVIPSELLHGPIYENPKSKHNNEAARRFKARIKKRKSKRL